MLVVDLRRLRVLVRDLGVMESLLPFCKSSVRLGDREKEWIDVSVSCLPRETSHIEACQKV